MTHAASLLSFLDFLLLPAATAAGSWPHPAPSTARGPSVTRLATHNARPMTVAWDCSSRFWMLGPARAAPRPQRRPTWAPRRCQTLARGNVMAHRPGPCAARAGAPSCPSRRRVHRPPRTVVQQDCGRAGAGGPGPRPASPFLRESCVCMVHAATKAFLQRCCVGGGTCLLTPGAGRFVVHTCPAPPCWQSPVHCMCNPFLRPKLPGKVPGPGNGVAGCTLPAERMHGRDHGADEPLPVVSPARPGKTQFNAFRLPLTPR